MPVGYSGHEIGLPIDGRGGRAGRLHRGAPHHARPRDVGLRPGGVAGAAAAFMRLVRDIRAIETSRWATASSACYDSELPLIKRLRRVTGDAAGAAAGVQRRGPGVSAMAARRMRGRTAR